MKYSYSKDIKSTFQDAENKVREELIKVGFGILTEINIKDAFKLKLDLDYKHYKILGACNPTLAHQALDSENLIGILMPCNILIIDNEDESIKIVFPFAKNLLEITDNNNILKLSEEVDLLLKKAFSNIE
tara:strand:+ start:448 stop:837 length:390 start_codon:yes stop_codon:yes gene_type:complete